MKARALALLLACCVASPMLAQSSLAQSLLAPGDGEDAVETSCSICHSLSYIPMNSRFMTAKVWTAEVDKMRNAFGAPIDDDNAKQIVSYLVAHYGVQPEAGGK
jgi:sulfite dehydrogenase (cytochrome) subunit B